MKDKAGHTRSACLGSETVSSNLIHDSFSLFVFKSCKVGSSRDAILAQFFTLNMIMIGQLWQNIQLHTICKQTAYFRSTRIKPFCVSLHSPGLCTRVIA